MTIPTKDAPPAMVTEELEHPSGSKFVASLRQGVLRLLLLILGVAAILSSGGVVHWLAMETPGPGRIDHEDQTATVFVAIITGLGSLYCFWRLYRHHAKQAQFFVVLCGMTLTLATALMECVARLSMPSWPAADLHGVSPQIGNRAWGREPSTAASVGFNAWGQRDRERTRIPAPGRRRIAFIGDSYLEDAVGDPLSVVVEDLVKRGDVEIVNLGVSATAPDEYFYRLQNVALPLGATECVMFIYLGNDLAAEPRTLATQFGVASVAPRGGLLLDCGLRGLNHFLMNRQRPVLQAWFAAGDLAAQETSLHQRICQSSNDELAAILREQVSLSAADADHLMAHLHRPEMAPFYEMLREPDANRFRSYFLADGVWLAATGIPPLIDDRIDSVVHWVRQAAHVCEQRQTRFLVVVIPEGFAVDPRMQSQWSPLTDMRMLTTKTERAGQRIVDELTASGIDVLDLHASLQGVAGAYLNLDGHWSELGIKVVAGAVADRLALTSADSDVR